MYQVDPHYPCGYTTLLQNRGPLARIVQHAQAPQSLARPAEGEAEHAADPMTVRCTMIESTTLGFMHMPGGTEWIILLVIGLLIFGKRLPEVGKSLGKGIVEFKKGLKGVKDDV